MSLEFMTMLRKVDFALPALYPENSNLLVIRDRDTSRVSDSTIARDGFEGGVWVRKGQS